MDDCCSDISQIVQNGSLDTVEKKSTAPLSCDVIDGN